MNSVTDRDRRRWPYAHWLLDQAGQIIVATVHCSEASLRIEVETSCDRIAKGKANRGGQVPTQVAVDGVSEAVWKPWIREVA